MTQATQASKPPCSEDEPLCQIIGSINDCLENLRKDIENDDEEEAQRTRGELVGFLTDQRLVDEHIPVVLLLTSKGCEQLVDQKAGIVNYIHATLYRAEGSDSAETLGIEARFRAIGGDPSNRLPGVTVCYVETRGLLGFIYTDDHGHSDHRHLYLKPEEILRIELEQSE